MLRDLISHLASDCIRFYPPPGPFRQRVVTSRGWAATGLLLPSLEIDTVAIGKDVINAESPICVSSNFICRWCAEWWRQGGICGRASDGAKQELLVESVEHHPQRQSTPANAVFRNLKHKPRPNHLLCAVVASLTPHPRSYLGPVAVCRPHSASTNSSLVTANIVRRTLSQRISQSNRPLRPLRTRR